MSDEVETLKQRGNELFIGKDFTNADTLYTQALAVCPKEDKETRKILLTNRSAARLGLNQYELAIKDAEEALVIDPTHIKAYYRKAAAFEAWNKLGEAYSTWVVASKYCDPNHEVLFKQIRKTKVAWSKVFRLPTYPITTVQDLIDRILLFTDKRERLSTLAHFWNASSQQERYGYFQVLLQLIGGSGELSENNQDNINPEVMVEMPMGNYIDMPRSRLSDWFDYFDTLSTELRTRVFHQVWMYISSEEQNDIIRDLKVLFSQAAMYPQADLVGVEEEEVLEREKEEQRMLSNNSYGSASAAATEDN